MKRAFFVFLLIVFVSIPCSANLSFLMTADDTTLLAGEATVVHVSVYVDDAIATGTNGLVLWHVAIDADAADVLDVTDHTFVAPSDIWDSGFSSGAGTGDVAAWVMKDDDSSSTVGIDYSYTEIFNFEVTALAVGTVIYDITGYGDLVDSTPYDVCILDPASVNEITVVPEPASLALFAIISGFIVRRRK